MALTTSLCGPHSSVALLYTLLEYFCPAGMCPWIMPFACLDREEAVEKLACFKKRTFIFITLPSFASGPTHHPWATKGHPPFLGVCSNVMTPCSYKHSVRGSGRRQTAASISSNPLISPSHPLTFLAGTEQANPVSTAEADEVKQNIRRLNQEVGSSRALFDLICESLGRSPGISFPCRGCALENTKSSLKCL